MGVTQTGSIIKAACIPQNIKTGCRKKLPSLNRPLGKFSAAVDPELPAGRDALRGTGCVRSGDGHMSGHEGSTFLFSVPRK